jgi:hypothetical protein
MKFLWILLGILGLFLLFGLLRTWQTQTSANQAKFKAGKLPTEPLDGFYKGTVTNYHGEWRGKTFDASHNKGINSFGEGEKYPFRTYTGVGLRDKDLQVFKIDYNVSGNPFWVRRVLDEVVETAPGKYLGKIHVRILPGLHFATGYFTLEKQ